MSGRAGCDGADPGCAWATLPAASALVCGALPLGAVPFEAGVSWEISASNVPKADAVDLCPGVAGVPDADVAALAPKDGVAAGASGTVGAGITA